MSEADQNLVGRSLHENYECWDSNMWTKHIQTCAAIRSILALMASDTSTRHHPHGNAYCATDTKPKLKTTNEHNCTRKKNDPTTFL